MFLFTRILKHFRIIYSQNISVVFTWHECFIDNYSIDWNRKNNKSSKFFFLCGRFLMKIVLFARKFHNDGLIYCDYSYEEWLCFKRLILTAFSVRCTKFLNYIKSWIHKHWNINNIVTQCYICHYIDFESLHPGMIN